MNGRGSRRRRAVRATTVVAAAAIGFAGCGGEPSAVTARFDRATAAVTGAKTAATANAALGEFESLLDDWADLGSDSDVQRWIAALTWLEGLEAAGWSPRERSLPRALRVRGELTALADGRPANSLETALTCWLLRRRDARAAGYVELPLGGLIDEQHLDRFASRRTADSAWSLILLSRIERDAGRHGRALHCLDAAERAAVESGVERARQLCFVALERSSCYQTLGRIAESARALSDARRNLESFAAGSEQELDARRRLLQTVGLATVRQASDVGAHARVEREVAALRAQSPDPDVDAQLSYYLAVALRADGRADLADRALDAALDANALDPKLRGMALLDRASTQVDRGEADAAERTLAEHAALTAAAGDRIWPLQSAQAGGLRATLARTRGAEPAAVAVAFRAALDSYHAFLASWSTTADGLGTGILSFAERRRLIGEVIELALATEPGPHGVEIALEESLRARAIGALATSLRATPPTVAEARATLLPSDDTGLLVLVPGMQHTHAFALDATGIAHARLPNVEALDAKIAAVWRELATEPGLPLATSRARFERASRALSADLFVPALAERMNGWKRCYFVGSDVLRRLPIEVLTLEPAATNPSEARRFEPLGVRLRIAQLPSTAVGVALARRAPVVPVGERRLLALVAPSAAGAPDDATIHFDDDARLRITASWPRSRWMSGASAQISALEPGDDALLIFAHGAFDPSRARPRGIRIAPGPGVADGLLFPDVLEAAGARVPALCLLAACDAANTDLKLGSDDADHLGASLLRGGAQLVLIAAARLEQDATAQLAASFLEACAGSTDPLEALRLARDELRRDPRFDHPHFWGTWVALGL